MEQFDTVYITASNLEEAKKIAKALVEERLAACVNIMEKVTSIYKWGGEMCDENEVAMFAITTRPNISSVIERTKALHSYENPCIVSTPITSGHQKYLDWVYESTV